MSIDVDPITLEVVCEGLIAIVKEMRATIIRAAYSSAIYEFDDFSCALFNGDSELVAQSWDHPGHVLPLPFGVRAMFEDFADDLAPGDVILVNDCYRGGTHLNDVALIYPMFDDSGRPIIFPAVRAHWVDVGGMVPGSYSGLSTNVYQEGVRIPPIKIIERGRLNRGAMALLMANMRMPDDREGDFNASLGACRVAERRILQLYRRYGAQTVERCVALNLDRTERRMREKIAALPDGDYHYEDYLEYYNEGLLDPVIVRLCLTIAGDRIKADFAGSNPQVPGVVNSSLAVAGAGVIVALKSTLDPGGAINHGAFRPIEITAPPASIVDVRLDAPAGAHGEIRKRAVSVTMGALSQINPDIVSGDLCGSSFPNLIGGWNERRNRPYVYFEAPTGGNGGFRGGDGPSTYGCIDFGNLPTIQPAEAIENEMPLLIERSMLRTDSAGDGCWRGGLGLHREVRVLGEHATYSVLSDRAVIPPFGMLGAGSAACYDVAIRNGTGDTSLSTPGKATGLPIRRDDRVIMRAAGGGGYGDPLLRDPMRVHDDLAHGYISPERAHDVYGLVVDAAGATDEVRTANRRAQLGARRLSVTVVGVPIAEPYAGRRGRHRLIALDPGTAQLLGVAVNDLIEMLGNNPAPLRAWVRISSALGEQTIELDDFGRRVLGVVNGDHVGLRRLAALSPVGGLAA